MTEGVDKEYTRVIDNESRSPWRRTEFRIQALVLIIRMNETSSVEHFLPTRYYTWPLIYAILFLIVSKSKEVNIILLI